MSMSDTKTIDAYPLCWPMQWTRTASHQRRRANFSTGFASARDSLVNEVRLLGGRGLIISTNIPLRRDGLPYAGAREPDDPGVAAYFDLYGQQQCVPCDKWNRVADNLHAINLCIGALRGLERWGAREMVKASFRGFVALPEKSSVNYFQGCATPEDFRGRYRDLSKRLHPDAGGNVADFQEMSRQYQEAAP